ncbi:MAG: TonB-dependent receptor [Parvularculaceae bacterium]
MSTPVVAQTDAAPAAERRNADEIVVTAQKREQSINDVGLTLQAATGDQLDDLGIDGPEDLGKLVPGFTFTQSIYSTPVFTLRGIGLYDATFGAAPSVSIYTDQIPRNVPVSSDALDLDIERVEVLKGPQGTLFGQSSTGGAINYIVAKPTDEFEAGASASYERFDRYEVSGFISGPLSDSVRARLAVRSENGGAWQRSISRPDDENGAARRLSGRLTVDFEPTDRFRVELMATGVSDKSDPLAPKYDGTILNIYSAATLDPNNPFGIVDEQRYADLTTPTSPGFDGSFLGRQAVIVSRLNGLDPARAAGALALLGTPLTPDDARAAEWTPGLVGKSDNSFLQFAGRADYEFSDDLTLTSLTSYAEKELDYGQDLDATTAVAVDVPIFGSVKAFNQEVRLGWSSERVNWILGGTYDDVSSDQTNFFGLIDYSANEPIPGLPITITQNDFSTELKTFAVFGNIEYAVTPQLTVQGGIRYTNNKQDAAYCYNDPAFDTDQFTAQVFSIFNDLFTGSPQPPIQPGECFPLGDGLEGTTFGLSTRTPVVRELNEDSLSLRAVVDYKFDQGTLVYATFSRGFKAGVFSAIGASSTSQYASAPQEEVLAYEAGFKAPLANGLAHLNAAAFYYDYSNKQVRGRTLDPIFGLLEQLINVPESYVFGVEADLLVRPTDGLTFGASATFLDSGVTSDFSQTPAGLAVYNAQGYTGNFNGSILPYTPKFSANVSAEYAFPFGGKKEGFLGGNLRYQGEQNATFVNDILLADEFVIPSFTTVDLRAGLRSSDGRWEVSAYGENVFNEAYATAVSTFLDTRLRYFARPAIYGFSVSLRY